MLQRLENLEILHLEYRFWSENGCLPVIYQNCLKKLRKIHLGVMPPPPFPTGRYAEIWEQMQGSNQIYMNQLQSLMSLPLIESITCVASDGKKGSDEKEIEFASMKTAQNLTSLKFLRSKLTLWALGKILGATPNLRQLEYEFWIDGKLNEEPAQYYDCAQLDNALKPEADRVKFVNVLPRSLKFLSVATRDMPLLRPVLTSDYTYETLLARLYEYVDVRKGMRHTQSGFRYTIFEIVVRYEMPSYTRPDTYTIKFTIDEMDDEEEMRLAEIEDDWIFDELPRPKYETRQSGKKQIIELRDPDTFIAVTLARLKNLEDLDLAHVTLDTEPLPPIQVGEIDPDATTGPSDWDTYSPYNPKSIHRRTLYHLLSLPCMESIACVAADRKDSYNEPFVNEEDMYSDDMNAEGMDAEDLAESDSDEEAMDAENVDVEGVNGEDMNGEGMDVDDRNTEDMDEGNLNEKDVNSEDLDTGDTDLRDLDAEDCDVEFDPIEQPYKNVTSLTTPKLQKLKYEFWMHTSVMGEFEGYLDCEQMNTALEPVRDTLRELSIGIDYVETFAQGFFHQATQETHRLGRRTNYNTIPGYLPTTDHSRNSSCIPAWLEIRAEPNPTCRRFTAFTEVSCCID
ncbi:hypothetical protein DPV78_010700 [Talaromyces pinophilus]|nr:hypothetical protein DPV78_010700 [Talaromyces pinophilus]